MLTIAAVMNVDDDSSVEDGSVDNCGVEDTSVDDCSVDGSRY